MTLKHELKPCPFCQSKAILKEDNDHHGDYFSLGCGDKDCLAYLIYWREPASETPVSEAVLKWNRRKS